MNLSPSIFNPPTLIQSLDKLSSYLEQLCPDYTKTIIISTSSVYDLYGSLIKDQLETVFVIIIPEGEATKTLQTAAWCWDQMAEYGADRSTLLIALGGGVVTDIVGFVASCYMRGIDFISLPTTLMAMTDAAIGGKTAVNFPHSKNLIGSFYFPKFILIDPKCLRSLPQREFSAGLAEVIKYGMIASPILFETLENQMAQINDREERLLESIIQQACEIKNQIVKEDPFDNRHKRALLNYGHTFAHAIEALTHYQHYLHGEAVAIGMSCAAHLSFAMGKIDRKLVERQDALCIKAGLPIAFPDLEIPQMIRQMQKDKKAKGGKMNFILPEDIGKAFYASDIPPSLVKQALFSKCV